MIATSAAKRVVQSLGVLLIVMSLVFFVGRAIGDPAYIVLGPERLPDDYVRLRDSLGLNDPILEQYARFIAGASSGDFGESYWQKTSAFALAVSRVPATLFLALTALLIAVPTAIILGAVAASRPRSLVDRIVNVMTLVGTSTVDFWLALILILIFAVHLQVLPTSGYSGVEYVLLPAMTLALRPLGRIAQITRSSMLDELAKPYVVMGRAKGLTDRRIIFGHCLRNALIPITTLGSDEFLSLMNGAIVVEIIFAWPGIGSLLIQAIQRRDLPLVEATVFVIAVVVIATNVFVDVAYRRINPLIRTGRTT